MFQDYDGMIPVSSTICDITKEIPENLFKGVSCVFHCAAFVSYQYPPDKDQLEVNNILGRY